MTIERAIGALAIRDAGPEDAALLLELMRHAFAEYRGALQPESSVFVETAAVIAHKLAEGGGFVAMQHETPIGCVIAEALGDRGYLGRLAVLPDARQRGVATRLVRSAEEFVRARDLPRIELNVRIALPGNVALFRSLGYRETARRAHPGFSAPTYLVMEKVFTPPA
jgi:ribosomal protein S18 acetylase RimI-like enzyme